MNVKDQKVEMTVFQEQKDIAKIINETFKEIFNRYKNSSSLSPISIHGFDNMFSIYKFGFTNLKGEPVDEIIILPLAQNIEMRHFRELLCNLGTLGYSNDKKDNLFFINCFDFDSLPSKLKGMDVSPQELWERLTGMKSYYENHVKDAYDYNAIHNEFVEVEITGTPSTRSFENILKPRDKAIKILEKWALSTREEAPYNILLFGERGAGKTWMLRRLQAEFMEKNIENCWLTPAMVYVNLRDYAERLRANGGIGKLLIHYIYNEYSIHGLQGISILEGLIGCGRIILLLDGLDELTRESTEEEFEKALLELLTQIPLETKAIVTTRETKFSSPARLKKLLDIKQDLSFKMAGFSDKQCIRDRFQQKILPKFEIINLEPFKSADITSLAEKVLPSSHPDIDITASNKFSLGGFITSIYRSHNFIESAEDAFLLEMIENICQIPACCRKLISQLENILEQLKNNRSPQNLLRLFELAFIDPLIMFNIIERRGVSKVRISEEGKDPEIIKINFNMRLNVIEEIARFMIEQKHNCFDANLIKEILIKKIGDSLEYLMIDLRSQSVFRYKNREKSLLQFRTDSIFEYFAARHIFTLLSSESRKEEALRILGRISFTQRSFVLKFLKCFRDHGMQKFDRDIEKPDDIKTFPPTRVEETKLIKDIERFVIKQPLFSIWTKFLNSNLKKIGFFLDKLSSINEWERYHDQMKIHEDEVLLFDESKGLSFAVMCHELTNKEFFDFLSSENIPKLIPKQGANQEIVIFEESKVGKGNKPHLIHPLNWSEIRRIDNKFRNFTNSYHLFSWNGADGYPKNTEEHPVVWISLYVCAIYCNWKTVVCGSPEECFYEIGLIDGEKPYLKMKKEKGGYRLPNLDEWRYAARGGSPYNNPLEGLEDEDAELLKQHLLKEVIGTQDVRLFEPNDFGISGMIGNVRELAHIELSSDNTGIGMIVGSTWVFGLESLSFDYEAHEISSANTNLDVGFRMARSLNSKELSIFKKAKQRRNKISKYKE
jgi:hypothetical protein